MIGLNPLRTKVLITTDEVLFHAPIDGNADIRYVLNSIIIAERRFVRPMLGDAIYNDLCTAKNRIVTDANKTQMETLLNTSRDPLRRTITLNVGDYVNSDDFLNSIQKALWQDYLHKIVAECVYFSALPTNRARFSGQGVQVNNPTTITLTANTASIELKDLKHLMDRALQDRIAPLMEDMHQYLCKTGYPNYVKDCGCSSDGIPYQNKRSDVILGMYDDEEVRCRCSAFNSYPVFVQTSVATYTKETIAFENVDNYDIVWTSIRLGKFGTMPLINVYVNSIDGKYRLTNVEIVPDNIVAPTNFHLDFGDILSGTIIIG